MRTFLTILKTDYLRTGPRLAVFAVVTVITMVSILLAVYFTGTEQVKGHIALVAQDSSTVSLPASGSFDITVVPERPPYSALVEQKYDAYVTVDEQGDFQVETLRNNEFKKMLLAELANPGAAVKADGAERGTGVNIIGFMMMLLLMISFMNLFAFADDKEQGQLRRIAAAPASFVGYLAGHCVYCLSMLVPEFILLVLLKLTSWDIGFSLLQYAGLMTVLGFLGISFALLLNTLIRKPDNARMLGNSIIVLTSILAGCYYSFSRNNAILDGIIKLLPQKELIDFAMHLQTGDAGQHAGAMIYVAAFSLGLVAVSCAILRNIYVKGASTKTRLAKAANEE